MDFKKVPIEFYPIYAWSWNGAVSRDGIKKRIDEMYGCGIRSFYIIPEPKNFRPNLRRTYLSPEYLSDEYFELVKFSYEYACELGMAMWLYDEGGWPSGMACGKIRAEHPELAMKNVVSEEILLKSSVPYRKGSDVICASLDWIGVEDGAVFDSDVTVREYRLRELDNIRTDIADKRNTEEFLKCTHERFYDIFGDALSDIRIMFDDEPSMGNWTPGFENLFFEKYGYRIEDYIKFVTGEWGASADGECRAMSDYIILCGEIVCERYFRALGNWLHEHGMLFAGHLDLDNFVFGCKNMRYGNTLKMLRCFDVPGIDVIWGQISYPVDGSGCREGYAFFPRIASSAANQNGGNVSLSESFAVYGAQLTPEEMRYVINYQAVRGINLFNFNLISYEKDRVQCLQYRPNFIAENPGMASLGAINEYTARLSQLLQLGRPQINTALYYPFRTVCAGGKKGEAAEVSYEALGNYLEGQGVSFDIIDEQLVLDAEVRDGALVYGRVKYENVFVPDGIFFEPDEVIDRLNAIPHRIEPCVFRKNTDIIARKTVTAEGDEIYLICNLSGERVSDEIGIISDKIPYMVELDSGEMHRVKHSRCEKQILLELSLLRGECAVLYLSEKNITESYAPEWEKIVDVTDVSAYVVREYTLFSDAAAPVNVFHSAGDIPIEPGLWPADFSGTVEYSFNVPAIPEGEILLDLGEIRYSAEVFINGDKVADSVFPPYRVTLGQIKSGDRITVAVSNTAAQACANTEYFANQDIREVGPYHKKMIEKERVAPPGGLCGVMSLYIKKRNQN